MTHDLFNSSKRTLALLLAPAAILAPSLSAQAPDDDADSYLGESPERYAQVKVLEGDVNVRKGDTDEPLARGIPVGEGDVVESRGRGVLQLGDGSRIAFGSGTRFQVAALFTDQKGERQVLLRLDYGRIRVSLGAQSEARIRVDTPSGTASLADKGSASLEVDRERTVRLRVHNGRIRFANDADRATIAAGERLTVYGSQDRLDRVRSFNTYDSDAFDEWSSSHLTSRRRASWDRVPKEIRYYADDLDDNGDWVYVDDTSSWCWRPRVSVEWRPYWRGRWGAYAGGMTWVSDDPWGYVTHHHGRWGWGASLGWYWIPGVYYSPAWVAWNNHDSYFGWAPLGYWNSPCSWGYGSWGGGYAWNVVSVNHIHHHRLHSRIHSDVNIIRTFNRGSGGSTWTGSGPGRPLTPGWQRGPLVVTRQEFSDPGQFQRVVAQRPLQRERIQTYNRQAETTTGRTILRRTPTETRTVDRVQPQGPTSGREVRHTPFEDRSRPVPGRSVVREPREVSPANPDSRGGRPMDAGRLPGPSDPRPGSSGREVTPRETFRDRPKDERPREVDRPAPREVPRETSREPIRSERPREFERPAPRETPREYERPTPREAPRYERPAPREAPREMPREAPRYERPSSPAPSHSPSPAPRSAPDRAPSQRPHGR